MSYNAIELEHLESGITLLKLDRAEKLNAINVSMFKELSDAIERIDCDDSTVVVIVAGEGGSFSSGLDFYDLFSYMKSNQDFNLWEHIKFMQDTFLSIFNSEKIYIAAIDGYCVGAGLDLASACDLRIATKKAKFSIAETKLGVVADLGVLQHLSRILNEQIVKYWACTSSVFSSDEAYSAGLLLKVCDSKEELMEASKSLALKISSNPYKTVSNTKKVINHSLYNPLEESLRFAGRMNLEVDGRELLKRFETGLKS